MTIWKDLDEKDPGISSQGSMGESSSNPSKPMVSEEESYENWQKRINTKRDFLKSLSKEEVEQYKKTRDSGFLSQAGGSLLSEVSALKEGAVDLVSDVPPEETEERRRNDKIHTMASGWLPNTLGRIPPYMVTGIPTRAVGVAATGLVKNGIQSVKKIREALGNTSSKIPTPGRNFKETMNSNLGDDIAGSAIVGAAEGGIHPDETAAQGALSSSLGQGIANLGSGRLQTHPKMREQPEIDLNNWYESKGGWISPAGITNSTIQKSDEAKLRNNDSTQDFFTGASQHNAYINSAIAADAIGVPRPKGYATTPEEFNNISKGFSKEYDELLSGARGSISLKDINSLGKGISEIISNDVGRSSKATLNELLRKIVNVPGKGERGAGSSIGIQEIRNPLTGRMQIPEFSGIQYQELRSRIKAEADNFWKTDRAAYKVANDMLKSLDEGMENGIRRFGDTGMSVEKLKDLNERFSISEMLREHAYDVNGKFDIKKLSNHMVASDTDRILKESGNRVKDIHKLVKQYNSTKQDPSNALNSGKVKGDKDLDKGVKIMTGPKREMGVTRRLAMNSGYKNHYPQVTGWANPHSAVMEIPEALTFNPNNKVMNINQISRAAQQGSDVYFDAFDSAISGLDSAAEYTGAKGLWNYIFEKEEEKKNNDPNRF